MNDNLIVQLTQLPPNLAGHLVISVIPLGLAVLISVPLGIAATMRPRIRGPVLAIVSMIQTIPGLALLALMVPILVAVGDLVAPTGIEVPALGALPVLIALTLYGMLPIVRNTVAGIEALAPDLVEAAHAIGMTPRQVLMQVELPLAAPTILAGIRTSAVWVVGMGTLATPVGQTSLGNYIFAGLQTRNVVAVLVGCVASAGLALLVDGALAIVEGAVAQRRARLAGGTLGVLGLAVILGIAAPRLMRPDGIVVQVGTKGFTEQYVLGRVIEGHLVGAGWQTSRREGLGSAVMVDALMAGEVDVYVDYSGTLWANHLKRTDTAPGAEVEATVCAWLAEAGATCVGALGFENAYAVAVRRADAEAHGWKSIADLAPDAPGLQMAGDYEFFQRPEWIAVRDAYQLRFAAERPFDPTFMYEAVGTGEVDAISAYTSDGRIAAFDLETLTDPLGALPPYDALLIVGPHAPEGLAAALADLVGSIDVDAMREANRLVDVAGQSPTEAADWLSNR